MEVSTATSSVEELVEQHGRYPGALIEILQDVQHQYSYLPRDVLREIAHALEMPVSQVYSVATFYHAFSLEPRGKHPVSVCMGTACHVQGGQQILESLERELGIRCGETDEAGKFSLEQVRCLGCCGLAPVVTVGEDLYGKVRQMKIRSIMKKYRSKE